MRRKKLRLFLKSFTVTSVFLWCIIALLIGTTIGHSIMFRQRTGQDLKIIEITEDSVLILGRELFDRNK
jgi:hypothetical protein